MLLLAQAGDVLLAGFYDGVTLGTAGTGLFYTFQGEGQDLLGGIYYSDPYGNPRSKEQPLGGPVPRGTDFNLDDFFRGDRNSNWSGFIRWNNGTPEFFVPASVGYKGETTPDWSRTWTNFTWNAIGAVAGGVAGKIIGALLGIFGSTMASDAWILAMDMQDGDARVYIGPHYLVFHAEPGGNWKIRQANYSWDYKAYGSPSRTYWTE